MTQTKQKCENCKFYSHRPNILGGIAECIKEVKPLNTFWANDACNKFEYAEENKLKEQKDFYKMHLGDTLNVRKD